jgi:hypothetical protein
MGSSTKKRQRGNSLLEFALCITFLFPLLSGTVVVGLTLVRNIQTSQVARDAGHMYARYVDFSIDSNKDIVVRLAVGLNMTRTGGNGVVTLTTVTYIDNAQCTAAGLSLGACTNWHKYVISRRIYIGNSTLHASDFGTPVAALLNSEGNISPANYMTAASALVPTTAILPALAGGDLAYVSEAYFSLPELSLPYYTSGSSSYAHAIF